MDGIERLECVYYPGPVPCNGAALTILSLVFDKIHFPGVYLPKGDYDKRLLQNEIARLERLEKKGHGIERLIGILQFLEYRLPLDGILEYPSSIESIFGRDENENGQIARAIYDVTFPPRKDFEPSFDRATTKGMPDSDEAIAFAGDFYYQAGAISYSAKHRIPLLDDGSGLPLPFRARYKDNAKGLATLLAVESLDLALPDLPVLTAEELVDFRAENVKELHNFRASMLRYGKALNADISANISIQELQNKIKFFVETEISPTLHDLERDLRNPNRPWHRRMIDGLAISSSVVIGALTGGLIGQTAAEGIRRAVLAELEAKGDKQEASKRNGLYYLLKAKALRH